MRTHITVRRKVWTIAVLVLPTCLGLSRPGVAQVTAAPRH